MILSVRTKTIFLTRQYQTRCDASNSSLDLDINSARCDKGTHTSCRNEKINNKEKSPLS